MSDVDSLDSLRAVAAQAQARAARAQVREIEAHRRAITMHEDAAALFDRFHQPDKARDALQRAEHARKLLRLAIAEQASWRQFTARRSRRIHAILTRTQPMVTFSRSVPYGKGPSMGYKTDVRPMYVDGLTPTP
jgi:hypothetical protein